jgi:hypothetical protein
MTDGRGSYSSHGGENEGGASFNMNDPLLVLDEDEC